jgi:hypothetical protein
MKKAYWVNGNFNGNGCQDAVVEAANSFEEAVTEAEKMGIEPYTIEDAEIHYEIIETRKENNVHIERCAYIAGTWYPESFFE